MGRLISGFGALIAMVICFVIFFNTFGRIAYMATLSVTLFCLYLLVIWFAVKRHRLAAGLLILLGLGISVYGIPGSIFYFAIPTAIMLLGLPLWHWEAFPEH